MKNFEDYRNRHQLMESGDPYGTSRMAFRIYGVNFSTKSRNFVKITLMIPSTLQGILWSKNIKKLDQTVDKIYIIHQVLAFGDVRDTLRLLKTYPKGEITQVFTKHPQKIYSKAAFHFAKNILLEIKDKLDEKKYLASPPRTS